MNWLVSNLPAFKKLADEGDADFVGVVQEMQTREDLQARL